MRRRHALIPGGLLLLQLASPASAEGLFGAGLFFVERPRYEFRTAASAPEVESREYDNFTIELDETLGVTGRIVRGFGPKLQGEIELEYLRKSDVGRVGTRALVGDGWGATTSFKLGLRAEAFRPFLSAGVGMYQNRAVVPDRVGLTNLSSDLGVRVGAGIDVYTISDMQVSLVASYLLPVGDLVQRNSVAMGVGARIEF